MSTVTETPRKRRRIDPATSEKAAARLAGDAECEPAAMELAATLRKAAILARKLAEDVQARRPRTSIEMASLYRDLHMAAHTADVFAHRIAASEPESAMNFREGRCRGAYEARAPRVRLRRKAGRIDES